MQVSFGDRYRGVNPSFYQVQLDANSAMHLRLITVEEKTTMSEANKAIARRLIQEVWNHGNLAAINDVLAPNYVGHAPPETMQGRDGYRDLVTRYRTAMPDMQFTIDDLVAEGDRVVIRWTIRGTQTDELAGIPPTGKQATITGLSICRIAAGQITEECANWDALGFFQQLGAVPQLGQAKGRAAG